MKGKICLVTGANSGIGKFTAIGLANLGATVVMVCRNDERGRAAREEIVSSTGNESIDLLIADLSLSRSIRQLADDFLSKYERLDVLVNNAGAYIGGRTLTEEGLETTFALNHLGYFLLTNLLLDLLKSSAPARIVNVASEAHRRSRIEFDDLMGERSYKGFRAYGQSKLANILFTYELARRLDGTNVTVNCLHPGVVATNFAHRDGGMVGFLVKTFSFLLRRPAKGAETAVYLASSADVDGVSGRYFVDKKEVRSSAVSYDESAARRLWQVSEERTGPQ